MSLILLCEPQKDLATAIQEYFENEGYTVEVQINGLQILECLRLNPYDSIVIAIALSGLDGMSVIRSYRSTGGIAPILVLSGKECSEEKRACLDAGADAYIAKPFLLSELAAQLRALLRRPALRRERVLISGNIALDTEAGTVTRDDIPVHLFPMEFKLLQFFLRHPNQVFDAHAILERVWQKSSLQTENTVRTHIKTLRKKIDSRGCPSIITTVRGLGYKISC